MRIRSLKPDFFKNETLAELPAHARLLFQGLWLLADSEGRLVDRPKRIRAEVFPYEDVDVHDLLEQLAGAGFIVRYVIAGEHYLAVGGFRKHQRLSGKEAETKSEIPPPPRAGEAAGKRLRIAGEAMPQADDHRAVEPPAPVIESLATVDEVKQRGSSDRFTNAQEGKGKEGKGREAAPPPAPDAASPPSKPDAKTHHDPEVRLAPWISIGARDARREAENRATLASLLAEHGEPLVQRVAEAFRHREGRKAYPDQLIEPLSQAARADAPPPDDPLADAVADAIRVHGWRRCFDLAGLPGDRVEPYAQAQECEPAAAAFAILCGNRPAARAMLGKLGGAAASGAA